MLHSSILQNVVGTRKYIMFVSLSMREYFCDIAATSAVWVRVRPTVSMIFGITRSQAAKFVNIQDISTLEDETTTLSRKIGKELQNDTASYPRRSDSFSFCCRNLNSGMKQVMMFWKSIMYSGIFNQWPRGREEKWIRNARHIICTLNLITLWVRAAITQSAK